MSRALAVTILTLLLLDQYEAFKDWLPDILTGKKCFDELGCFSVGPPFFDIVERPISLFPNDRESINTKFLLFTRQNPKDAQTFSNIRGNIKDILGTSFNPQGETKFVVPGFISNTAAEWKPVMVEALLKAGADNVFLVDWDGGDGPIYEQAVANTRVVGAEIALFVNRLTNVAVVEPESVHIIGHSLGSHIAGYAGKRLKNLGRITGVDPAGPYFRNVDPVVRLDRGDALFVDAIHTNAAPILLQGFGLPESIAHFDFFPNGGHLQPGCRDMGEAILYFLLHPTSIHEDLLEMQCNHLRAIYLFISSINKGCELKGVLCSNWKDFVSGKCGSCDGGNGATCVPLGMDAVNYTSMIKRDRSLNFFLNTTATEPFCEKSLQ